MHSSRSGGAEGARADAVPRRRQDDGHGRRLRQRGQLRAGWCNGARPGVLSDQGDTVARAHLSD